MPPDDYVSKAKAEVHLELCEGLGFPGASADHVRNGVFAMATADWYSDELSWAIFGVVSFLTQPLISGSAQMV